MYRVLSEIADQVFTLTESIHISVGHLLRKFFSTDLFSLYSAKGGKDVFQGVGRGSATLHLFILNDYGLGVSLIT